MEGRDSGSPKAVQAPPQHGHESHGTFSAFFRDPTGYPLMGSSPSIIHAPLAKRHNSSAQPFSVLSSPNSNPNPNPNPNLNPNPNPIPNPNPNPNLNSNVSPAGNTVVPNLNPNAVPNPNSGSSVYFGGLEAAGASPSLALMVNLAEPVKKKRGRPRKYIKDENGVSVSISPSPLGPSSSSGQKKKPPSGKKAQLLALGAAGQYFTPHVLTVNAGEDVSTKIITFTSQGPWAVCILSANGAISNATLRHAGVSGGAVTYEGRFEILSLSGSFLLTENLGTRSRTGGLSVSLAGPDGHVIGGGVAGLLMAASPVQVVVGTFLTEIRKPVGSNEESKPSGLALVRAPVPAPMMHQVRMDVNSMQEHILGPSGEGEVQPRGFPSVPLQVMDCFANHFDGETRGNTEPQSASPAGP